MWENSREKKKVVTFGEVLMLLFPLGNRQLQEANQLGFFFGGTEMKIAASLAHFGLSLRKNLVR